MAIIKNIIFDLDDTLFDSTGQLTQTALSKNIKLFPETKEILLQLKTNHKIYLVTLGNPATQNTKLKYLGIQGIFDDTYFPDPEENENKFICFQDILEESKDLPDHFVSIGNRIDTDIAFAKQLGMKTVLFEHGKYKDLKPKNNFEMPDYKVKSLSEFMGWLANAK